MGAWGRGGDRAGRSSRPFTVWGWEDVDGRGGGSSARFEKATRLLDDSSAKEIVSSFVQHERESWEDGTFAVCVVGAAGSAACRIRLKVLQHICMLGCCLDHAASMLVTMRVEMFASGGADGLAGEGMCVSYDTLGHYTWSCCARGRGRSLRAAGQRAAGSCERVRRIRQVARGE